MTLMDGKKIFEEALLAKLADVEPKKYEKSFTPMFGAVAARAGFGALLPYVRKSDGIPKLLEENPLEPPPEPSKLDKEISILEKWSELAALSKKHQEDYDKALMKSQEDYEKQQKIAESIKQQKIAESIAKQKIAESIAKQQLAAKPGDYYDKLMQATLPMKQQHSQAQMTNQLMDAMMMTNQLMDAMMTHGAAPSGHFTEEQIEKIKQLLGDSVKPKAAKSEPAEVLSPPKKRRVLG